MSIGLSQCMSIPVWYWYYWKDMEYGVTNGRGKSWNMQMKKVLYSWKTTLIILYAPCNHANTRCSEKNTNLHFLVSK